MQTTTSKTHRPHYSVKGRLKKISEARKLIIELEIEIVKSRTDTQKILKILSKAQLLDWNDYNEHDRSEWARLLDKLNK